MRRNGLVEKTVNLYSQVGWKKWFARIRFWDAPYIEVEKLVPKKGLTIDLGCGEGIFTNFLGISSPERKIIGIEIDRKRIEEAYRGVKNVAFKYGDATKIEIPKCDVVIMFHLLHHLSSYKAQEKLILKTSKSLTRNGSLIIIEVDKKPFLKYLISWLTDHFIVAWLFERKLYEKNIFFRDRKGWTKLIKQSGFRPRVVDISEGKPFSHIIITAFR